MSSRYATVVDPSAANNSHAFALAMVGWNKRVLELGAAGGHVTRALVNQRCVVTAVEVDPDAATELSAIAAETVVGDLNDPTTLDSLADRYDVVLAGDVLEHLLDPQRVLEQAVRLLAPGGCVVASLPNIGHADVRLALLRGRFEYSAWGLLDATHTRFFTLASIIDMLRRAGLVIADLKRVRIPALETELSVDRQSVSTPLLEEILTDPDAETYQFVLSAVRADGAHALAELGRRHEELCLAHERLTVAAQVRDIENARLQAELAEAQAEVASLREELSGMRGELARVDAELGATRHELAAWRHSRTYRYTTLPRAAYRAIRGRG